MPDSPDPVAPYVPLPHQADTDPQALRESARSLFDQVADAYDRARPGYPDALYDDLVALGLLPGSTVLEVGCGTGQATRRLVDLAADVWCVELGPELARKAEERLAGRPGVRILVGAFEDVDLPEAGFDAVFSATAFHWIDPRVGYPRAASLLRPGGILALATSAHVAGGTQAEIVDEVAAAQDEICPEIGPWRFPPAAEVDARARAGGDIAQVWARVERSFHTPPDVGGLFAPPSVRTYEWLAEYDRDGYLDMLATQSSYIALDPDRRHRLFERIGGIVDRRLGGRVTKAYLAILAVSAVRKGGPTPGR